MKKPMLKSILVLGFLTIAFSLNSEQVSQHGAEIGDSPELDLAVALEDPSRHLDQLVTVEGKVVNVCQMKGCWLELMTDNESHRIRVKFENYAFFVPKDSSGQLARLEGKFVRETLSKRAVDHLIEDGATLRSGEDGTVETYSFVARAVELRNS